MPELADLLPGLAEVRDEELRGQVLASWRRSLELSGVGDDVGRIPFAIQALDEPLVRHVGRVVTMALALEHAAADVGFPPIDHDVLIGSCLLHDVDKLCLLEPGPDDGWHASSLARRYPHGVLGAMLCRECGVPEEIVHIVATHSTSSSLPPEPFEGVVLHYADMFAADAAFFAAGATLLMAPKPR